MLQWLRTTGFPLDALCVRLFTTGIREVGTTPEWLFRRMPRRRMVAISCVCRGSRFGLLVDDGLLDD